ncbi:hypothetical protein ACI2OX_07950 [Bacillus sp. N9]
MNLAFMPRSERIRLCNGCARSIHIVNFKKEGISYDDETEKDFGYWRRLYRATTAFLLAQKELGDVVLVDIPQMENPTKGKALDMLEAGPVQGFDANIIGTSIMKIRRIQMLSLSRQELLVSLE